MRTVELAGTGVETTALGFGCAHLFREPDRGRRQRLLEAAFDSGIRHFDIAPMYGLGVAERELGRFAQGRRDHLVLATKFGITPSAASRLLAPVQAQLQRLRGRRPATLDVRVGAVGGLLYRSGRYDAATARTSLERSLRELGTDHVDLLFLHDPLPGDVRSEDVRGFLEDARAAGRIRAWGIAGEPEPAAEAARRLGGAPLLQLRSDVLCPAAAHIVFGAIGRALPRIVEHISADDDVRRRWSETVGADLGVPERIASLLIRDAVAANPEGTVLFSTVDERRIAAAADAAAHAAGDDLETFRRLVREELA
jgi:D-threo-aldose 1-dehydrogenase